MLTQIDIEDLVQRCRSTNARAYIKEAVDCYRIGAYRACVITTWIALVYDFIDKLRELAVAGDSAAQKRVGEFDTIQQKRDTEAALKFERDVLSIAKDEFELITIQEMADLGRLFEDRNRCGHPNLNRDNEVYTPPPELARLHLRVAIEHVLERPPVQGKAALGIIRQIVDSEYFPIIVEDAEKLLKSTPLPRAKQNLVREFTLGALVSLMREPLTEKKMYQRLAAAQAAQRMHPEITKSHLREKFDDAVLKTSDANLNLIVWLLASQPDLQPLVKPPTWLKIENYIKAIPSAEIDSIFSALIIPQLHAFAMRRLKAASRTELSTAISRLRGRPNDILIDRCIEVYALAPNYDAANTMAKELIHPLINHLSKDQAKAIIVAGSNNGQIKESTQYTNIAYSIKTAGILTQEELKSVITASGLSAKLGYLLAEFPFPLPQ